MFLFRHTLFTDNGMNWEISHAWHFPHFYLRNYTSVLHEVRTNHYEMHCRCWWEQYGVMLELILDRKLPLKQMSIWCFVSNRHQIKVHSVICFLRVVQCPCTCRNSELRNRLTPGSNLCWCAPITTWELNLISKIRDCARLNGENWSIS